MKRNRTAKIAFRKANKQNVETIHKCIHTGYNALPWNNADFREIKRTKYKRPTIWTMSKNLQQ